MKMYHLLAALMACCLFPVTASAQGFRVAAKSGFANRPPCSTQPVVASGLHTPVKLIFTEQGNLLVAEMGLTLNAGRISIIDPISGHRRTLLDGLPSGFVLPSDITSGPSGLAMRGRTLYVAIGGGDTTLPGSSLYRRVANPSPSSPIFSSVLAVDLSAHAERTTDGFTLTLDDHLALQGGSELTLDNGGGDRIKVRLLADFPDYLPEPRAYDPYNVRPSDPFGLVVAANHLYVVDYDSNSVRVVDLQSGESTTLVVFAPLPRGVKAVPDGIRLFGDQLLVTLLSGPPFPADAAQVRIVDPATGSDEPFITGLTTAIDVLPVRGQGRESEFLTLEMSTDIWAGEPGRLRRYASPDAAPVVVADCLNAPTSMARDERTRDLFVTEIFTGQIVKVAASTLTP